MAAIRQVNVETANKALIRADRALSVPHYEGLDGVWSGWVAVDLDLKILRILRNSANNGPDEI